MLALLLPFYVISLSDLAKLETSINNSATTSELRKSCMELQSTIIAKRVLGNKLGMSAFYALAARVHFNLLRLKEAREYSSAVLSDGNLDNTKYYIQCLFISALLSIEVDEDYAKAMQAMNSDKTLKLAMQDDNYYVFNVERHRIELAAAAGLCNKDAVKRISTDMLNISSQHSSKDGMTHIYATSNYIYYRMISGVECDRISTEEMQLNIKKSRSLLKPTEPAFVRIVISNALLLSANGSDNQCQLCIDILSQIRSECKISDLINFQQYDVYRRSTYALAAIYSNKNRKGDLLQLTREINQLKFKIKDMK